MKRSGFFAIVLAAVLLISWTEVFAELPEGADGLEVEEEGSCAVEAVGGGLECIYGDGGLGWKIEHPSLWEDLESYQSGDEGRMPVGPVVVGERTFYGVWGDLLEVDVEVGAVVGRRRFPAPIAALELVEGRPDQIKVVIHYVNGDLRGVDEEIEIVQGIDGPAPSQNVWMGSGQVAVHQSTRRDADWLKERTQEEEPERWAEVVAEASARDGLNLYLLGHLEEELDDQEGAAGRWAEALAGKREGAGPPWTDILGVSWRLEAGEETRRLGAMVYEQAVVQMEASRISPERMANLVGHVFRHMDARGVIEEAVEEGEVDRVAGLSERIARVSPLVEAGEYVWEELAIWLESHGREGEIWRARAERNRQESHMFSGGDARRVDLLIPIVTGLFFALFFYTFLIGLKGGASRRREKGEAGGVRDWIPSVGLRDALGVALLLVAMVAGNFLMASHVSVIGTLASAPLNVYDDSLAAPDVEVWLEGLAGSAPRDELLEIAREERAALEAGRQVSEKSGVADLVHQAVMADARASHWREIKRGRLSNPIAMASLEGEGGLDGLATFGALGLVPWMFLLALFLFVGGVLGRTVPVIGLWGPRLVPGGASLLAPIGGLLLAGLIAGWLAIWGFDQILSAISRPAFGRYFGLEGVVSQDLVSPDRLWAWVCVLGALVLQGLAQLVEATREGRGRSRGGV